MTTRRKAGARTGKVTARITASRKPAPVKAAVRAASRKAASAKRAAAQATVSRTSSASAVAFPADCTIAQADALKAQLSRLIGKASCVKLDLSSIRRIDTAALQVFTAFVRERRAAGRPVECSLSEPFKVTTELLGLSALFVDVAAA